MADDVIANPGAGGATFAADDIGGVMYPRVKVAHGPDGSATDTSDAAPLPTKSIGAAYSYQPGYSANSEGGTPEGTDPSGNKLVRAQVLTDEGSFRANFSGSSLDVTIGTCTFTNGSAIVTGTNFDTYDLHLGDYVKFGADAESAWIQVESVDSASRLTLVDNYAGAGGTGASSCAIVRPITGTGGTISVTGGQATIACGTTAAVTHELERDVDYGPLLFQAGISVSQRIANQDIYIGLYDAEHAATPYYYAWFHLTGTTNTVAVCESGQRRDGAPTGGEIETTSFTLPNGATTATARRWRIEVMLAKLRFYVDGVLVAEHYKSMPRPMDKLTSTVRVVNGTTPATNTNAILDYLTTKNFNMVDITIPGEVEGVVANQPPLDAFTYSQAGVIAINTDLIVIDCRQYRSILLQCTSMGTTGVVTAQWCDEPTFATPITATLFSEAGASATTFNAAVMRYTQVVARYFRLRLTTATTAGTTTIYAHGCQFATQSWLATQPVSGTVTATVATTTNIPSTGQGSSTTHHAISAATTNATSVKATAGVLGSLQVSNINAAARYLKLYNLASAPTVGTSTPVMTILLPPNSNQFIDVGPYGMRFSTGIAYALTTGITVADTGAVAVSEHSVSMFYT